MASPPLRNCMCCAASDGLTHLSSISRAHPSSHSPVEAILTRSERDVVARLCLLILAGGPSRVHGGTWKYKCFGQMRPRICGSDVGLRYWACLGGCQKRLSQLTFLSLLSLPPCPHLPLPNFLDHRTSASAPFDTRLVQP